MNNLKFTRMSGTGNTFIVFNEIETRFAFKIKLPALARRLCLEIPGFQTDGFIILRKNQKYDFEWDFYNSDGSSAEMCGNAARCASLYYYNKINRKRKLCFLTKSGPIKAHIKMGDYVEIELPEPRVIKKNLRCCGKIGTLINSGVPHFVLKAKPNLLIAKKISKKLNANVTFVEEGKEKRASTYERGVHRVTLSCGTGALSAAKFWGQAETTIYMPGGKLLVKIDNNNKTAQLLGEAQFNFDFILYQELLK